MKYLLPLILFCLLISAAGQTKENQKPSPTPTPSPTNPLLLPSSEETKPQKAEKPKKEPCKLTEFPAIRELKLGMSIPDLQKIIGRTPEFQVFTQSVYKAGNEKGATTKSFYSSRLGDYDVGITRFVYESSRSTIPAFDGIEAVIVYYFKGSAFWIIVRYGKQQDIQWKDLDEFIPVYSEKLNIPKDPWFIGKEEAKLYCNGFDVRVLFYSTPTLELRKLSVLDEIDVIAVDKYLEEKKKKEEAENSKKKEFKP